MKMVQLEFPFVRPAAEQILLKFRTWLIEEEDGALRAGTDLESRHQYSRAQLCYRRNEVLGDVREKLTELGVKFD